MSAITQIINSIEVFLKEKYPEFHSLNNPYDVEDNPEILLKRSYGFYIGLGRDLGTMVNEILMSRELYITLTLESGAAEHNQEKRRSAEIELFEEQVRLINSLHKDPAITEVLSAISYQSDSGLGFVYGEHKNYLKITNRFLITYIESAGA